MRLQGKVAIITGAGSGMGKAMTTLFLKEGAKVVATDISDEALKALKEELKAHEKSLCISHCDVSKKEDNEAMIDLAVKQFGTLDILVNNAGIMDDMGAIGDCTDQKFDLVHKVNEYGPFYAMRKAVNTFKELKKGGSIINIASVGAYKTVAGAAYSSSKAGIIALTRNSAFMYQPEGIRFNAIAPGGIATNIAKSMGQPNMHGYGRVQKVLASCPPMGASEDIANAALFLASDESRYISGVTLPVDGSWSAA
ncbi:MAG: glucose 1-dehydrogenase [Bacilli bacterium]